MSPLEQHIYIEQKVQKISSNQNRDLLPQEIDLALNIAQMEIVKSRIRRSEDNTGFAIDIKQLSDVENIIVRNKVLDVYIDSVGGDIHSLPAFSFLPFDYLSLLNERARVYSDCKTDYSTATSNQIFYLSYISFPKTASTTVFYSDLAMNINGSTIVAADISNTTYPYFSADEKFTVSNTILEIYQERLRNNEITFEVYWERFNTIYKKDSFIVVSKTTIPTITLTYTSGTPVLSLNNQITFSKFTLTSFELESPIRLINNEMLPVYKKRYHSRTTKESPIGSLSGTSLQTFYNSSFIINKVLVDYVRMPNRISLPLNRSCELIESLHYEICDKASEIILLDIASQLYQAKEKRNSTQLN